VNPYAGLATRTLAFAADAAIVNAVAWFVAAVVALGLSLLAVPHDVEIALAAIGAVLAVVWSFAYFVFFWSTTGQTPGNRMLGVRVVSATTGRPISARRAALRVPAILLAALPLCAGFLLILVDRRRRALQDRLAGTLVFYASADSERLVQAPHSERADDVADPVHERPDAGEDEQRVGLLDEELAARPVRQDDHQDAADQRQPPQRVLGLAHERLDRPPDADEQEQEPEDVGEPVERGLGTHERDHARDHEQHAERDPQPAQVLGHRSEHELLNAREHEHAADDHANGGHRRLVELQDDERRDDPGAPGHEPEPPVAGDLDGRRVDL
jgi:uncharacterized RDD family membrane protein YckC